MAAGAWRAASWSRTATSYPVSFKTVADYVNWSTWSDGVKAQLKDVLGLDVAVLKIPDAQIWDQFGTGEFEIGMNWVGGGPHLSAVYADFHSKDALPIGEAERRELRPHPESRARRAAGRLPRRVRRDQARRAQPADAEDRGGGGLLRPFNASASFLEASGKNFEGFPQSPLGEGDIIPRPYGPEGWQTMAKLKPIA